MRNLNFYGALGLSTLSGCLWFLAVTPFDWSALAWIAAVPMFMAVERTASFRRALLLGWWAGVVETAGGFYWLIDVMRRFADFPWIGAAAVFLLFCATRAIIFLLFTAAVLAIRKRIRVPMTLLGPIAMVSCELLVPQLFPCGQWISQAWNPQVIQVSELTGPLGVTALLMMINGALYDLILNPRAARYPAIVSAVLLAAALIFGAVRMRQTDEIAAHAPRLSVGLVQPNFAYTIDGEFSREEVVRQLTALQEQSRRLEQEGAQLLVWSEGSFPLAVPRDFSADFSADSLATIRRGFSVPTLIGAEMYDAAHEDAFNSAILLDRNGKVAGHYDKVRLLAFGEYVPGIETFPWLRNFLPEGAGRFTAGSGPGLITLQGPNDDAWRLGPVICYEDILQGFLRGVGQQHPDLLVNFMVWRGHRTLGASGARRVCQCGATREYGARGQFGCVRIDRSQRPRDSKNLRQRSLPPSSRRRRRGGHGTQDGWRTYGVRGRRQSVRLPMLGRHLGIIRRRACARSPAPQRLISIILLHCNSASPGVKP
jgi:apolipoprotein N-acyltransferase